MINKTRGDVSLSLRTTTTWDSLCTLQDDGTMEYHHTSVSSSSKVSSCNNAD